MTYKYLLTNGNRELAADGIFTWSIPALAAKLEDGSNFLTCPQAGACAQLCYARSGTYNFSNVKRAHVKNLELILDDLNGWKASMVKELTMKRYLPTDNPVPFFPLLAYETLTEYQQLWSAHGGKAVRIHDSGDFFSPEYFNAWLEIASKTPWVFFYAYTKEVSMTREFTLPDNFTLIYSMGGKQDDLIDIEKDRHADVFPSMDALIEAGYTDQEDCDILAALLPTPKIGIVVNNIKHLVKKQGQETFGSIQRNRHGSVAIR